jgi:tRNA-specific 2-thiouridylase
LHLYTIGQRKGIEIGGTGPYYVVAKDYKRNVLVVTNNSEDPALSQSTCEVADMHWLVDADRVPERCSVQVRYRQQAQPARVVHTGERVTITFDEPQRAITPGQSAVLYDGDVVLGGGVIEKAE